MAPLPQSWEETTSPLSHPFDLRSLLPSTSPIDPRRTLTRTSHPHVRGPSVRSLDRTIKSLIRRQQTIPKLIPETYAGLNKGPPPGTVVGIVLGSVAGFLLLLWLIYTCVNFANTRGVNTYEEETVVRRRSRSPRSSRRSPPRSPSRHAPSRSRSRSEVIEVSRHRSPQRRETRRETVIMEERVRPPPPPVEREDDIVEVIEEHSPPPRRSSGSRRVSGYRTVDPTAYGGGDRPLRKLEDLPYSTSLHSRRKELTTRALISPHSQVLPYFLAAWLMFTVARRGLASILRSAFSPSIRTICIETLNLRPNLPRSPARSTVFPTRSFGDFSSHRQRAAVAAAIEDEIADEVSAQQPPSDTQIAEATRQGSVTKFKELGERKMVCNTIVKTLVQDMSLETMTQVQSLTINETLKGGDILAQARTGTGKTLAFLIPVLQNIIDYDPKLEHRGYRPPRTSPEDIRAIIISPTRELAEQIGEEARKLARNTGVVVQTAVGGTQKSMGLRKIKTQGCHILVGTPGRLNDILSDPYSQVRAPNLSAFVLDEADRLLDQGFAPDIEAIQKLLPDRAKMDRQTLLFSATVPREVVQIVRRIAKPDFQFVRTVQEGERPTHEKVPQKTTTIRGFENQAPALIELCKREIARKDEKPFKAIVYFNSTADVSLMASVFRNLKNPGKSVFHRHPLHPAQIIEIHARLSQRERTVAAESFRRAESAIMVSSDVTARGMDFPNVTHVIQVGVPPNRDSYIHRIGRTGRGDKKGEGWLILTELESREAYSRLYKLPITTDDSLQTAKVDMTKDAQLPEDVAKILTQTIDASRMVDNTQKVECYKASLGVMAWAPKSYMIQSLNDRAKYCWGLETIPKISPMLAQRLGLSRVPGVEVGQSNPRSPHGGYGGSSGARSGGFRGSPSSTGFREGDHGGQYGRSRTSSDGYRSGRSDEFERGRPSSDGYRSGGSDRSSGGRRPFDNNRRERTNPAARHDRRGYSDPAARYDRIERSGGFGRKR
ncbi:MAG: hypothetical protein Q9218_000176 [Villophora microphyllina]